MQPIPSTAAVLTQPTPDTLVLSGPWTARSLGALPRQVDALQWPAGATVQADATRVEALDTAGAWVLNGLVQRLHAQRATLNLQGLAAGFGPLLAAVTQHQSAAGAQPTAAPPAKGLLEATGQQVVDVLQQGVELLAFVGEVAVAMARSVAQPSRIRWRPILFNIRSAGFDALPIVAVLSFLLGVVVAYQAADQLRRFGANLFVADLVGLSMLRE
ncbi:MAG: ABC transporter permease, partial [Rhodoferax sp.]|nr:ABC transporter permease [Rhodoferax sp.]